MRMNLKFEQDAFEAFMAKYFPLFPLKKGNDGKYRSAGTQHMWNGWQLYMRSLEE